MDPSSRIPPGSHRTPSDRPAPRVVTYVIFGLFSTRMTCVFSNPFDGECVGAKITLTFLRSSGPRTPREGTIRNGSGVSSGSFGRLILGGGFTTLHSHGTPFRLCSCTYTVFWWPT